MRGMTLGVIAITSTMTFACTSTTTIDNVPSPGSAGSRAAAAKSWQSKLALSRPGGVARAVSALANSAGKKPSVALPSGGADGGAGGACGLRTGDATCDTCIDASCCAENTACMNDADCTALVSCGDACMDDACISACMSAHPSGAKELDALTTCMQSSCTSACGGGGGGPGRGGGGGSSACGFDTGDATCDSCLGTSCCADATACENDTDCTALMDCAERCTDDACEAACETAHPSGTAKLNALSACANDTCGSACSAAAGGPGPGPGPSGGSCGLTSGDATCDTCLNASCCTQTTTCIDDADCVALVRCYDACSDDACASACDTAHPGGLGKLDAVASCAESTCKSQCGF